MNGLVLGKVMAQGTRPLKQKGFDMSWLHNEKEKGISILLL